MLFIYTVTFALVFIIHWILLLLLLPIALDTSSYQVKLNRNIGTFFKQTASGLSLFSEYMDYQCKIYAPGFSIEKFLGGNKEIPTKECTLLSTSSTNLYLVRLGSVSKFNPLNFIGISQSIPHKILLSQSFPGSVCLSSRNMGTTGGVPTWPELLGSNDWEGLLEPLDDNLRGLILRCGDFCQATYDAFNNDQNSKFCGSSRYGKRSFFEKVMLESGSNYQVSGFLYATAHIGAHKAMFLHSLSRESWDRESNWIGYIAVTTDECSQVLGRREIYVAFRGTTRNYEWINVLGAGLKSAEPLLRPKVWKKMDDGSIDTSDSDEDDEDMPKIMQGWLKIYVSNDPKSPFTNLSARAQLLAKIEELRNLYRGEDLSITFTGHSLGASLSILAAFDLVENGLHDIPVSTIVFGSPQVGNKTFNKRLKQFPNLKVLHVKNEIDLIPHYPGHLLGYHNSGIELVIDTRKSPFLKDTKNPSDWHNLQAMLHVVAGWNGAHKDFELKVKRSLALVNKSAGILRDECLVPESWWVEKNKGMVLDESGKWTVAAPADEDLPVPEY